MYVDMTVRNHGEYLLICHLFVQNNISHKKMEHLHSYPAVPCICRNILSGNSRFRKQNHHQLPRLTQHFGICDHQDAFSESHKDGSHLA